MFDKMKKFGKPLALLGTILVLVLFWQPSWQLVLDLWDSVMKFGHSIFETIKGVIGK